MIYVIQCKHTPNPSLCINIIIAKNEFKWQYAKLIFFFILNCAIVSDSQSYFTGSFYVLQNLFLYTFGRLNEKTAKVGSNLPVLQYIR